MKKALLSALVAIAVSGCAPPVSVTTNYASVSSHTLQVATDKQVDVVWVQQVRNGEFVLMRCYNAGDAPTCVKAKTP